jgi:glycosyltransferase involved in cell wall biosynthesis
MGALSVVTCIMPTADRRIFVDHAIRMFLAQDYPDKELLIVDDGKDSVEDIIPQVPSVRYFRLDKKQSLGAKRNFACEAAKGDLILHWDDDDWYAPWRIRYQVGQLVARKLDISGLDHVYFVNAAASQAWEYIYVPNPFPWVCGATLCYLKCFWKHHPFPNQDIGEDTRFVFSARHAKIGALTDNRFFVARMHTDNTAVKRTTDTCWHPRRLGSVRSLVGSDWEQLFGGERGLPRVCCRLPLE